MACLVAQFISLNLFQQNVEYERVFCIKKTYLRFLMFLRWGAKETNINFHGEKRHQDGGFIFIFLRNKTLVWLKYSNLTKAN